MLERADVDLRLGVTVTADDVASTEPDLVVLATGAIEAPPLVDGYDTLPAWLAADLLDGERSSLDSTLPGRLVVLGGGQRGLATATWTAARGVETVVLSDGRVGTDTSGLARRALVDRLRRHGVAIHTGRLTGLRADGVRMVDGAGDELLVPADAIVIAEPLRQAPTDGLVPAGVATVRVGDAREPRGIADAVAEARDAVDAHLQDAVVATG